PRVGKLELLGRGMQLYGPDAKLGSKPFRLVRVLVGSRRLLLELARSDLLRLLDGLRELQRLQLVGLRQAANDSAELVPHLGLQRSDPLVHRRHLVVRTLPPSESHDSSAFNTARARSRTAAAGCVLATFST